MNFSRAVLALTAVVCLASMSCSRSKSEGRSSLKAESQRKTAPGFTLKDINGKNLSLAEYRGKVVLLNFWATWCGPCKMEIPWFTDFEQKYKNQGFAVIGISMDDDGWDSVRPFVEHMHMNYRVALGNDSVAQAYGGVDSLPTTFLIDRAGRVVTAHVGLVDKSDYQNEIDELLQTSSAGVGNPGGLIFARAK